MLEKSQPVELPDDYYLSNFHSLAGFVHNTYRDLLDSKESDWYQRLCDSPICAQRLYVRLLMRKGPVFRLSRLNYVEINDLEQAAKSLSDSELAIIKPPLNLEQLLPVFTKPELLNILQLAAFKKKSRASIVEHLNTLNEPDRSCAVERLQCADKWISLQGHGVWNLYTLCFFGNLYQDTSEFVLRDLGSVEYEAYDIKKEFRIFQTREQLDAHMCYFECAMLWKTIDKKSLPDIINILNLLPEPIEGDTHLLRRIDRLRNTIGRQLERIGNVDKALEVFALSDRPPARERRVRMLLAEAELSPAQAILAEMLDRPKNENERQVALRLQKNLDKRLGKSVKRELRFRPDTSTLTLTQSADRVEIIARRFYSRLGTCSYCENQLVNGVLGLFIWDIIFYSLTEAFYNPFQSAPSDFYTTDFLENRRELLDTRFEELDESLRFSARVVENFNNHHGKENPLVRWGGISYELRKYDRVPRSRFISR